MIPLVWGVTLALVALSIAYYYWFKQRRVHQARERQRLENNRQALQRLSLPQEVLDRFLILDRIDIGKFLENYEQYDPKTTSPYYPRWFAAAYPDVLRYFSEFLKTGNVAGFLAAFECEQIKFSTDRATGMFDTNALYAFKDYYKRAAQVQRFECGE